LLDLFQKGHKYVYNSALTKIQGPVSTIVAN
jgi:hypothetical protein